MSREASTERAIDALADAIARRRLVAPARLLLDMIAPVDFLASQFALFARPLAPGGRWQAYVAALSEEAGWQRLRERVRQPGEPPGV
jgi:hypothetical protein